MTNNRASSLKRQNQPGGQPEEMVQENRNSGVIHGTDSAMPLSGEIPQSGEKGRGSWTVVEQFVRDGYSYRLARRPLRDEGTERLTKREQEALDYALDGLSNKTIAYALGLAPSTVGVLLFRAAAKLGVKSRRELLQAYAQIKAENGSR